MGKLVSVIVCTYNSGKTIIETLNSVNAQTWTELELIITDDYSTDDTIDICQIWLNSNMSRFVSTRLISFNKNTGVPANVNRGLYASHGEWIKLLGGDDTLKPDCIADNMSYIASNPETKVLFSRLDVYRDNFEPHNLIVTIPALIQNQESIIAPYRSADSQYKMLLICDRIHYTPSVFLHRETLLAVGGYDERYKMMEDYPMWLKLTKAGYRLCFMEKVTVNYRQHSAAINNTGIQHVVNPNYFKQEDFRKRYTYPFLPAEIRLNQRFKWYASQIFRCSRINLKRQPNIFLYSMLTTYLNPFSYYIWLKKHMIKYLKSL
jgi:alpha-1,3-rhamnosyltransferase